MFAKRVMVSCCLLISIAGTASAADTEVSGRVILDGAPLAAGKITCHLENGEFIGSVIKDGEYHFDKVHVPTGSFKVTIEGDGVPAKYGHEKTTPLSIKVMEGANVFSFDLTK